jgi:Uma2 family endonuclease
MPLIQEKKHYYTYADYLEWDEDFRAEIVNGVVYAMSPPLTAHQILARNLTIEFGNYLRGKPCQLFPAPFGVRLFPKEDHSDDTVVEPDLVVVCDSSKIDKRGCNGAPDLVIEILSPSNAKWERIRKFNLYLEAGVREYWIVDPEDQVVQVHILDQDRYTTAAYGIDDPEDPYRKYTSDIVPVSVLPGFAIDLKTIFPG